MHSILDIIDETADSAGPDLITLDDLKFALGITDTSEDVQLQAAITMQSRIIAEYCDRRFGRATCLETFTFDYGETLPPRQALTLALYPVEEIFEISMQGATNADYQFDPESGRLWLHPGWTIGSSWMDEIAVSYSGGYDLPEEAPARLQRAIIECVNSVRMSSSFGARDPSIREVQHGDTRITYMSQTFAAGTTGQHLTPS